MNNELMQHGKQFAKNECKNSSGLYERNRRPWEMVLVGK